MTKKNFIDLIIHRLNGGNSVPDTKSKYHPEIVLKYLELAYSSLLSLIQDQSVKYRDLGQLDSYVKTYSPVSVTYSTSREEYYSALPAPIIGLYMNRGIRQISPLYDQSYHFIYRQNNTSNIYNELEVSIIDNKPRYYLEGDTVYYEEDYITEDITTNGVLMKLVVPLSEIDEDEDMPIPAGKENVVMDFVINYLQQMFPEDVINDSNSKQI